MEHVQLSQKGEENISTVGKIFIGITVLFVAMAVAYSVMLTLEIFKSASEGETTTPSFTTPTSYPTVSGFYVGYIPGHTVQPRVVAEEEYLGYYFKGDGTYTMYISTDGRKWIPQYTTWPSGGNPYTGTWLQKGDIITINYPGIVSGGTTIPPSSWKVRISADGNKIFSNEVTLEKVSETPP
ncbi:MAG: hypothetical protein QXP97_00075 [Desulfurococcus sp.]|uniref:hypothetical protein n=1 Tax=Desulfurococcus sp. TaxID=51678 RepID=UPI00316372D7